MLKSGNGLPRSAGGNPPQELLDLAYHAKTSRRRWGAVLHPGLSLIRPLLIRVFASAICSFLRSTKTCYRGVAFSRSAPHLSRRLEDRRAQEKLAEAIRLG